MHLAGQRKISSGDKDVRTGPPTKSHNYSDNPNGNATMTYRVVLPPRSKHFMQQLFMARLHSNAGSRY